MDLPAPYSHRPLRRSDARAVYKVMAAQEEEDLGEVVIDEADIVGDWGRPSFDISSSTVGVFSGADMVAYAEVTGGDRGDAAVHPDHRGRGLGTALAGWMQAIARAKGTTVIGMPVPQGSPSDRMLAALGYHVRWTSWVLQLPAGADVPARAVPEGYVVREAAADELEQIWTVQEDAFLEWSVREREPFADWRASTVDRPGFAPWTLRVVADPSGAVVAIAVLHQAGATTYVPRLATRADQSGRGLAQALLVDASATGRLHGATTLELSTDSRTGALGLYERVGMVVTSTWVNRAIGL